MTSRAGPPCAPPASRALKQTSTRPLGPRACAGCTQRPERESQGQISVARLSARALNGQKINLSQRLTPRTKLAHFSYRSAANALQLSKATISRANKRALTHTHQLIASANHKPTRQSCLLPSGCRCLDPSHVSNSRGPKLQENSKKRRAPLLKEAVRPRHGTTRNARSNRVCVWPHASAGHTGGVAAGVAATRRRASSPLAPRPYRWPHVTRCRSLARSLSRSLTRCERLLVARISAVSPPLPPPLPLAPALK